MIYHEIFNDLFSTKEVVDELHLTEIDNRGNYSIILYNDDIHTFDFVIETLVEVCEHTLEQAEQCTFLVHFNGKCEVKIGSREKLLPMHKELLRRGLTSELVKKN